jgi:hypothetical protein
MSETSPDNPSPKPATPRTMAPVAHRTLSTLADDDLILIAAQKHAAPLATRAITAAILTSYGQKLASCRAQIALITGKLGEQKGITVSESQARTHLLNLLEDIQSAARQQYEGDPTHQDRLATYGVGQTIRTQARPVLTQTIQNVLDALATESLPGIPPEKLAALASARDTWNQLDSTQTDTRSLRAAARQELKSLLPEVAALRRKIQLAADGLWPYHNSSNTPTRQEFKLPLSKPL